MVKNLVYIILLLFATAGCNIHRNIIVQPKQLNDSCLVHMDSLMPSAPEIDSIIAVYSANIKEQMNQIVGYSNENMIAHRPESNLTRLMADIILEETQAYLNENSMAKTTLCAITNIGGIRASLPEGFITMGHIFNITPFENMATVVVVSGKDLLEILQHVANRGGEALSNIKLTVGTDGIVEEVLVAGKPVEPNQAYTVVTLDYLATGGDNFAAFTHGKAIVTPYFYRDQVINYFKRHYKEGVKIEAPTDQRIFFKK